MRNPHYDRSAKRRTVSLTLNCDLCAKAKAQGINLSKVAEAALGRYGDGWTRKGYRLSRSALRDKVDVRARKSRPEGRLGRSKETALRAVT